MQEITRKKRPASFWNKHVDGWLISGLSQSQYCRNNSLKVNTFNKHKVRKVGQGEKETTIRNLDIVALPLGISSLSGNYSGNGNGSGISISLGNRATINISSDFDSRLLFPILKMVSEL